MTSRIKVRYLASWLVVLTHFVATPQLSESQATSGCQYPFECLFTFDLAIANEPRGRLFQASDGYFYGTTRRGGRNDKGTVFRFNPNGPTPDQKLTIIYSFGDTLDDGEWPLGGVIEGPDLNLYGTTSGGIHTRGTVFKMTKDGNLIWTYAFNGTDGREPWAELVAVRSGPGPDDWALYGTTKYGGEQDIPGCFIERCGTIFRITPLANPSTQKPHLTVLHSFSNSDGAYPLTPLVPAPDGSFFGITRQGGPHDRGTVYRLNAAGEHSIVFSFNVTGNDIKWPSSLLLGLDGMLYGTAEYGGPTNVSWRRGSIFAIDQNGQNFKVLDTFRGGQYEQEGVIPRSLMQTCQGDLYGTTDGGLRLYGCPPEGCGTLFRSSTSGPSEPIHLFDLTDGAVGGVAAPLSQGRDGHLYATAPLMGNIDGRTGSGTVYRYNLPSDVSNCQRHSTAWLRLEKVVEGGTAQASEWRLCAAASTQPDRNFCDSGDSTNPHPVHTGITYLLTEQPLSAGLPYASTGQWSCDGGSITGMNEITLAADTTVTCHVTNTYQPPPPILAIRKTADRLEVHPGESASFTITVSNTGAGPAVDLTITDRLPDNATDSAASVLSWSTTHPQCSISAGVHLTCTGITIQSGGTFSITAETLIPENFLVPLSPLPPGGESAFEIDGDLVVTTAGNKDWPASDFLKPIDCTSNPTVGCEIDLPSGKKDNSFGSAKEDDDSPDVVTGSIPRDKSDLVRMYVANERIGGSDFVYLAWERANVPRGSTNMDFELNQSVGSNADGIPLRTAGDLLVRYDLAAGGTRPHLGYHVWVTTETSSGRSAVDVCESSNSFPCWSRTQQVTEHVQAAVNTVKVVDPILGPGQRSPRTLSAFTFGEAKIDLQGAGIFPSEFTDPAQCVAFLQTYLKSRASDQFTADLKDFIKPIRIAIHSCAPRELRNEAATACALGTPCITSDRATITVVPK